MSDTAKLIIALILGLIIGGFFVYIVQLGNISDKWVTVVGTLGGVTIGGLLGILGSYLVKQSEFTFQHTRDRKDLFIKKLENLNDSINGLETQLTLLVGTAANYTHRNESKTLAYKDSVMPLVIDVAKELSLVMTLQKTYLKGAENLIDQLDETVGNLLGKLSSGVEIGEVSQVIDAGKSINNICRKIQSKCDEKIQSFIGN
jgi:hypothetical protein